MPLNKDTLKTGIKKAFLDQLSKKDDQGKAIDELADKIATAIDMYVKSATVSTNVTGTATCSTGGGPVIGTGTGTLS